MIDLENSYWKVILENQKYFIMELLNKLNKSDKFKYGIEELKEKYKIIKIKDNKTEDIYLCSTEIEVIIILKSYMINSKIDLDK